MSWRTWFGPLLKLAAAALVIVGSVGGARWILRVTDPGDRDQLQAVNDSLRVELATKEARLDSMRRAAEEAAQPHMDATAASFAGEARLRRAIAQARAAVRQDSLAMVAALEELTRRADEQLRLAAIERQTAAERIRRLDLTVTYAPVVLGTARTLVEVQVDQLERERALRRWWRSLIRVVCVAGPTAGGAAAGTLAAGPGGAAVGASVGLVAGATACR